ncbi:MAG: hypothetical protein A2287_09450 [Candidatus Melainabacteria bacterium RIFOXYA12_FULL_32_12]|nr:MAG: hypothetical protein A2287_09450 [Candidatus Melainabacteria bacterium RIFOXYA12_FULL_32_12]
MGIQSKYDNELHPKLAGGFAMLGLTNKQIAERLNITEKCFYNWVKRYPDFNTAVQVNKFIPNFKVMDCIYNRAIGMETKKTKKKVLAVKIVKDGEEIIEQHPVMIEETVEVSLPDVNAGKFWLTNRMPEHWKEKPDENSVNNRNPLQTAEDSLQNDERLSNNERFPITYIETSNTNEDSELSI